MLSVILRDALTSDVITVSGDGTSLRTYMYQEDLAYWLLLFVESWNAWPGLQCRL